MKNTKSDTKESESEEQKTGVTFRPDIGHTVCWCGLRWQGNRSWRENTQRSNQKILRMLQELAQLESPTWRENTQR